MHPPCTRRAPAVHPPCTRRAPAVLCLSCLPAHPRASSAHQDETLITRHTLLALDLHTLCWSSLLLPGAGPYRRIDAPVDAAAPSEGVITSGPAARIDGAGVAIAGVGLVRTLPLPAPSPPPPPLPLSPPPPPTPTSTRPNPRQVIFGGVGEDFSFVSPHDAWLLRSATDVHPRRNLARPPAATAGTTTTAAAATAATTTTTTATTATTGDAAAAPPPCDGPSQRACLGLCADGLNIYAFGGFDGEHDLNDLWRLELMPPAAPRSKPSGAETFDASVFKVRQARACEVLHSTVGAAGHNSIGMPIHYLVGSHFLARGDDGSTRAAEAGGAAEGDGQASRAPWQGLLSDGLSRGQRARVISAFRDDP